MKNIFFFIRVFKIIKYILWFVFNLRRIIIISLLVENFIISFCVFFLTIYRLIVGISVFFQKTLIITIVFW